jgi:hypothetical protein
MKAKQRFRPCEPGNPKIWLPAGRVAREILLRSAAMRRTIALNSLGIRGCRLKVGK